MEINKLVGYNGDRGTGPNPPPLPDTGIGESGKANPIAIVWPLAKFPLPASGRGEGRKLSCWGVA